MDEQRHFTKAPETETGPAIRVRSPIGDIPGESAASERPSTVLIATIGERRRMGRVVRGGAA